MISSEIMLKNISIFLFFSILTDSSGSRSGSRPGSRSGSRSSWGFKFGSRSTNSGSYPGSSNDWKPRPSVWDKCSKQNITNGEINCDINRGTGNYPIETADCTATCDNGYMLIGMTFDIFSSLAI